MKPFFFILLSALFCGCAVKKTGIASASENTFLGITELKAINLSEDEHHLSTKNDEIVIVYGWLYGNSESIITRSNLKVKVLHQVLKNNSYALGPNDKISKPNALNEFFFIGLLEFDNDLTTAHLETAKHLFENKTLNSSVIDVRSSWDSVVQSIDKDNDNLGIVFQRKENIKIDLTISGQNLNDKYLFIFQSLFNSKEESLN